MAVSLPFSIPNSGNKIKGNKEVAARGRALVIHQKAISRAVEAIEMILKSKFNSFPIRRINGNRITPTSRLLFCPSVLVHSSTLWFPMIAPDVKPLTLNIFKSSIKL